MGNKKKIVYVSGGITGIENYKEKFNAIYEKLKDKYVVLLPTMIEAELEYEQYMHIDFALIDVCDIIYMMDGWEKSPGAVREHNYATFKGLEVMLEDKWKQQEFQWS